MGRRACSAKRNFGQKSNRMPPIYDGPLALNASVGYKFAEVPRILNDQWVNLRAHFKSSLIDSEACDESYGDEAQAKAA